MSRTQSGAVAASAISDPAPAKCLAHTRLDRYRSHLFLTAYGAWMNIITKKVTSWAAIIAVPTFITGFYGMNVPYPGFSREAGFGASIALMILAGLALYVIFKRKDWL